MKALIISACLFIFASLSGAQLLDLPSCAVGLDFLNAVFNPVTPDVLFSKIVHKIFHQSAESRSNVSARMSIGSPIYPAASKKHVLMTISKVSQIA